MATVKVSSFPESLPEEQADRPNPQETTARKTSMMTGTLFNIFSFIE
jgi:hypothetical protein